LCGLISPPKVIEGHAAKPEIPRKTSKNRPVGHVSGINFEK
jgi:hypothetical protein